MPPSCAIVLRRSEPPSPRLLAAERRFAQLVAEVSSVEEALEVYARELAAFEVRWRAATDAAFAELERARRLVRRLRRLSDELAGLLARLRAGPAAAARRRAAPHPSAARRVDAASEPGRGERRSAARRSPEEEPAPEDLKALYRRLARLLHPDLASGSAPERQRRSDLMARANEAWRRRDRVALELLAERLGAPGGVRGQLTERERLAHLARRTRALTAALRRLEGTRARLEGSTAARLLAEAARRREQGGDAPAEAAARARDEAAALRAVVLPALQALVLAARRLEREAGAAAARAGAPANRGDEGASPWLATSALVRAPGDPSRLTAGGRALAERLAEDARGAAPWGAALTMLAYLAEAAGRPPPPFQDAADLAARWEALCEGWPGAPDLARALAEAPRAVEVGLRRDGGAVVGGLQLTAPDLGAGVRAALRDGAVKALAVRALVALGPREPCRACGVAVYAVHLLRVRGLDEVHGFACPRCGAVLRTFFFYGPPEGVAALAPVALATELVLEQPLRLGGAALALQMLPAERARLTARALVRRIGELCLAPHGIELPRGALTVVAAGAPLPPGARVPEGVPVSLACAPSAGVTARELARLVRAGARRRFRS